ncbi:hypothetical protein D5H75_22880 [Bailinhaonella thermotolerans]|uniref:Uncharacterized protein n=1 Tax=Bailinhaonella thermotolerans TaxID=1070861 RepID=A0A3A4APD2_9ACTN|nr:hypothetical protein D5H75_22880 [Bailinhaonella thermotolerans]
MIHHPLHHGGTPSLTTSTGKGPSLVRLRPTSTQPPASGRLASYSMGTWTLDRTVTAFSRVVPRASRTTMWLKPGRV